MLTPTLPDLNALDREALLKLLLAEHDERVAIHQRLLARETEIEHLKLLLAKLRRMQFGRRSEKIERQIEQLELRLEDLQADEGAATQADSKKAQQRRESASRKPLPDHLEREERVHRPLDEH